MAENVFLELYKTTLDYRTKVISIIFASGIAVAIPNIVSYLDNSSKAENERRKIELTGEFDRRRLEQEVQLKQEEVKVKELELQIAKGSKYQDHIARFIEQAMNQDIDVRIRFAEYFASVSDEPERWKGYLKYLTGKQKDLDAKLIQLAVEQRKGTKDEDRIDELLAEIRKIEVQVRPTQTTITVPDLTKPRVVTPARLLQVLGRPVRDVTGEGCQAADEPFKSRLEQATVGTFAVTMLKPAIASLKSILSVIEKGDPDLYRRMKSEGALCVRYMRGRQVFSSHAFGTAIDISIDGQFTPLGVSASGPAAANIRKVAEYFERAGWIWGGTFALPDVMHFEVGSDLFEQWLSAGTLDVVSSSR